MRRAEHTWSTDDESESGGCCLLPGLSPPGDVALQLEDGWSSELESGCIFSSEIIAQKTQHRSFTRGRKMLPERLLLLHLPTS